MVRCTECGYGWECADTGPADKRLSLYSGDCPSCRSTSIRLERCAECPVLVLDACRNDSAAGRLLARVLDLEFDLQHFRVETNAVTCEERDALRILEQERRVWEREDMKRREEQRGVDERIRMLQSGHVLER